MAKRPIGFIVPVTVFILASLGVVTIFVINWVEVFSGPPKISGQIVASKRSLRIGEQVDLKLSVPQKYEGVNRLEWSVEPSDMGDLYFVQVQDEDGELGERNKMVYPHPDRAALFTARKAGRCTIEVTGIYKGEVRQSIARIDLAVLP